MSFVLERGTFIPNDPSIILAARFGTRRRAMESTLRFELAGVVKWLLCDILHVSITPQIKTLSKPDSPERYASKYAAIFLYFLFSATIPKAWVHIYF